MDKDVKKKIIGDLKDKVGTQYHPIDITTSGTLEKLEGKIAVQDEILAQTNDIIYKILTLLEME